MLASCTGSPADADLAPRGVDEDLADPQRPGAPAVAAAQDRAHPRDHLLDVERLDDVVVGAAVEAAQAVGVGAAAAEHDHRSSGS